MQSVLDMKPAETGHEPAERNDADATESIIRLYREQFPVEIMRIVEPEHGSVTISYSNGTTEYKKLGN